MYHRLFKIRKQKGGLNWQLWKLTSLTFAGNYEYRYVQTFTKWQQAYDYAEHYATLYRHLGLTAPIPKPNYQTQTLKRENDEQREKRENLAGGARQ